MQSFGDETISECIKAETKNMNILQENSDLEKYFKDSILLSKTENKCSPISDGIPEKKDATISALNGTKTNINKNSSKFIEYSKSNINIIKSKHKEHIQLKSSKSTSKPNSNLKRNHGLYRIDREVINDSHENSEISTTTNKSLKPNNKTKLSFKSANSNTKNTYNTPNDTTTSKLSSSNTSKDEENSIQITPFSIVGTQDRCKLSAWGLPPNILQKYEARGVSNMFPWQVECLSNHKIIEENCNLVYSAPTSAGKTLVSEILIIKTVLERKKKAIFILPFISVVREKMYYFQDLLSDSGIRVEGFMGGVVPAGGFAATQVAIATIEKANSLVNRLMEENELVNLGAVVIDELHLVGDSNRGYLLELLLTKLKYMTLRDENVNIQLIGMSATLPNLTLLAEWLNAELYKTDFRPVPLNEQCKIGTSIYDNKLNLLRNLESVPGLKTDADNILQLCIETISDGNSVLIFCPTKNWCENLAEQLAMAIYKLGQEETTIGKILREQLNPTLISETLEQLKRSPIGLDSVLKNTVSFGVAFHHAGLTMDERDIIEGAFRSSSLRVLIATSTLSSGVNLPARRVIIRSPMFAGKLIDILTYKQMIGRAGRMGKDTAGESILVCKSNERKAAATLLSATLQPIESCLEDSGPLIRALLEAIASEVVFTPSDVELYTKCTLVSLTEEDNSINPSKEAIKFLVDNEFLLLQTTGEEHRWVATPLGKACLAASIPPKDGLFLLEELQKARRCFVLDTELHVVYLVTPLNPGSQISSIDWMTFLELWKAISESERRVGQLVGVDEKFLMSAVKGIVRHGKLLNIHRRFYTALALHDLVRECPLSTVCKKYGCCRGVLQSLQQSASTFAGMVTQFCKQLGWDCMELLVSQFQTRLQFGVCRELLDLLRLPMLNGLRARSLYKQGITCIAELAVADELDVERALYKALPFESEKEQDGEHETEVAKRNKMRTVFVTGRDGLTPHEAANMLVQEARALVQNELGLKDLSWRQHNQTNTSNNLSTDTDSITRQQTLETTEDTNAKMTHEAVTNNNSQRADQQNISQQDMHDIKMNGSSDQNGKAENLIDNSLGENEEIKFVKNSANNLQDLGLNKSEETKGDENNANDLDDIQFNSANQNTHNINDINDGSANGESEFHVPEFKDDYTEKYSLDFFDDSSFRISNIERRHSESLLSFKRIKSNKTLNSTVHRISNGTKDIENESHVPNKKLKVSHLKNVESPESVSSVAVNATPRMSDLETNGKDSIARSPSLFDDSLNLDTQICNDLEQNIDLLRFSDFEESKQPEHKLTSFTNTPTTSRGNENVHLDSNSKCNNITKNAINSNTQTKYNGLSWKDDSWNDSRGIIDKLNHRVNGKKAEETTQHNIRNKKNTNMPLKSTHNSTPETIKQSDPKFESTLQEDLRRMPHKRKFKDIQVEKSPVANVIAFSKNRRPSLDSNKSDSEDVVIPSQNINTPPMSIKKRNKLELINRAQTQSAKASNYISGDTKEQGKICSGTIQIVKRKIKPKLSEILPQNVKAHQRSHSSESLISNSDNDTPIKAIKPIKHLQKPNAALKKVPEICPGHHESKDIVNDSTNWNTLNIVKVGSDRGTFNLFKRELLNKRYVALALDCEFYTNDANVIGSKVIGSTNSERKKRSKKVESCVYEDRRICGAAISWENNISYYISFSNTQEAKITGKEQLKLLKELLSSTAVYVKCFATKEVCKLLYQGCGIFANCSFLDPKIANWLCDGSIYEKTFAELVTEHFPQGCFMMKRVGSCPETGPGLNIKSSLPGEFRASAESVLTWHITDVLLNKLEELSPTLLYTFKELEMKSVMILAWMELTGLGVSSKSLQDLSSVIREEMLSLEKRAYSLSGKRFNFSSSKEVGEVLGLYKGKKISVNKGVLEHVDHPISTLVISWRKLNTTQSKIIYPLLSLAQHDSRIHGNCVTCTLTGRVSMCEPNLQNVPKDFNSEDNSFIISVRSAFVPALGNIMLSADYCQLELRILAHFSKDITLCEIMQKSGDIFKSITAKWNHVLEKEVNDEMRQHTKQLCYGMIYGMGVKSLAENLSVDETEAKEFLESFMNAYPGIRKWLDSVVEEARAKGYVSTLLERRRTLPGINSTKPSEKSQAERQAVNTKVQGSAADIAKKAMVDIEERIQYEFPTSSRILNITNSKRKLRSNSRDAQQRGGYLVLQLHDELLYEINMNDLQQVATIVKESMEQVCQLTVPLPVKIKIGPTWGDLSEYNFQS